MRFILAPCVPPATTEDRYLQPPHSAHVRWISFTSIFSSPTDLSPPSHRCQMNDECLNIKATTTTFHSPILFYFLSPDKSVDKEQTGVWFSCVHIRQITQRARLSSSCALAKLWPLSFVGWWFYEVALMDGSMVWRQQMHINGTASSACVRAGLVLAPRRTVALMMRRKWHQGSDDGSIMSPVFGLNSGTCSSTCGLWTHAARVVWARRLLIGLWCTEWSPQRHRRWRRMAENWLGVP